MKNYEKKALIKFMLIYMISSLILFIIVAILYFFDQKKNALNQLNNDMITYISLSRSGNNHFSHNDQFNIKLEPSKHHNYPLFYENKNKNKFVSVACASKESPGSVYVVSADKSVLNAKLYDIGMRILFFLGIGFIIFLILAYYLALISIRPIKQSRQRINNVIEDILHDLNAPMTSIYMNCESLKTSISDPKQLKKIDRTLKSNKTIKFLYANLSSLIDRPLKPNKETIELKIFLEDRIDFYQELHPEASFESSLLSEECNTDSVVLERIIDNLLSNAIKYSQPNPHISISTKDGKIIIKDNGVGIKNCEAVFKRNYREVSCSDKTCGLGLGLFIVKKLCDEMGIKIGLKNNQPQGSIFTLYCKK